MKCEINEYDKLFYVRLESETAKDAAVLARLGINRVVEQNIDVWTNEDTICVHITFLPLDEERYYIR